MNIQHDIYADGRHFMTIITSPTQSHRVWEHAALKQAQHAAPLRIDAVMTYADAEPDADVEAVLHENW